MAASVASLESLPLLVLERICEYLDDDCDIRQSLWAFSLTSKTCCAVVAAQRFCQVHLKLDAANKLETVVKRWTDLLDPGNRHRHVRRLKVSWIKEGMVDHILEDKDWGIREYFDMHEFCRPSAISLEPHRSGTHPYSPKDWSALAGFISLLPGLKDLVWALGCRMPPPVLSAVHARGCRLHMHKFWLPSLIQSRHSPEPIDRDEYALVTSPCLSSVVVPIRSFETGGEINYIEDALMCMVGGAAPNLVHVWLVPSMAGDSLPLREAARLGKPPWRGFFPGTAGVDWVPKSGRLKSLVFGGYRSFDEWYRLTSFNSLRRFAVSWHMEHSLTLAGIATRGGFQSLNTLELSNIEDETEEGQELLHRFLQRLPPLQRLSLDNYISSKTVDIVVDRHGETLRNLSVCLYRDEELRNPLVVFNAATVQILAEKCPRLEQLRLPINRTRGDPEETSIYRALAGVSRLQCAWLTLYYSVGPDEEFWDEQRDGEHPLAELGLGDELEIRPEYIREAFSNSAFDANLALSIFNRVSSGNKLAHLRLEMCRKTGRHSPGESSASFRHIFNWLTRSWACERDARGNVTVRERDEARTIEAGKEWEYLSSEFELWVGEEVYEKVFKEIWPQKTAQWWSDWESLPLSDE